jgi:hypothetical protein
VGEWISTLPISFPTLGIKVPWILNIWENNTSSIIPQ